MNNITMKTTLKQCIAQIAILILVTIFLITPVGQPVVQFLDSMGFGGTLIFAGMLLVLFAIAAVIIVILEK